MLHSTRCFSYYGRPSINTLCASVTLPGSLTPLSTLRELRSHTHSLLPLTAHLARTILYTTLRKFDRQHCQKKGHSSTFTLHTHAASHDVVTRPLPIPLRCRRRRRRQPEHLGDSLPFNLIIGSCESCRWEQQQSKRYHSASTQCMDPVPFPQTRTAQTRGSRLECQRSSRNPNRKCPCHGLFQSGCQWIQSARGVSLLIANSVRDDCSHTSSSYPSHTGLSSILAGVAVPKQRQPFLNIQRVFTPGSALEARVGRSETILP